MNQRYHPAHDHSGCAWLMASISRSRSKLDDADDATALSMSTVMISRREASPTFRISVVMYQHPTRSVNYGEQV